MLVFCIYKGGLFFAMLNGRELPHAQITLQVLLFSNASAAWSTAKSHVMSLKVLSLILESKSQYWVLRLWVLNVLSLSL